VAFHTFPVPEFSSPAFSSLAFSASPNEYRPRARVHNCTSLRPRIWKFILHSRIFVAVSELNRWSGVLQVYLSVRNGAWFAGRVWDGGLPLDLALFTRCTSSLVRLLPYSFVSGKVRQRLNARFDHVVYGLRPSHGVLASPVVTNDDLPCRILSGSVQVRPGIARLTSSGVQFTDGTHVDDIDAVICGTGMLRSLI